MKRSNFFHPSIRNLFFLYLSHYAVHTPIQAPEIDVQAYQNAFQGRKYFDATYAVMIESVDRSVGRIVTELDRLGLTENTIEVFLSDNGGVMGTSLMEPLRGG